MPKKRKSKLEFPEPPCTPKPPRPPKKPTPTKPWDRLGRDNPLRWLKLGKKK